MVIYFYNIQNFIGQADYAGNPDYSQGPLTVEDVYHN
jgi:hypothetical protein